MGERNKLRFGFIGAGNIGNVHMNVVSRLTEDVEMAAVTDAYLPLAEQRAKEYGIPRVYRSAEELINDEGIDAVIIGVPNKYHASIAVKALEAGKHVVLEKPMASNVEEARQIVRVQRETGKILMVPHQMRWEPLALQVKELAQNGSFGRIYNAKAGWMRRKGIPGWGTWFTQKAESGGGPLIDIGVHLLDLSLYLMGNPKPVSVFGSTYAEFGPHRRGIGTWGTPNWNGFFDVEDLATALIKMEDGSTLSLDVSWAVHGEIEGNGPYVHLMGAEGGAVIRNSAGKLFTEKFNQTIDIDLQPSANHEDARTLMFRHFIECVREGKEPISNAMTGFTNNLILDAIYESSRTGHEVRLNWDI